MQTLLKPTNSMRSVYIYIYTFLLIIPCITLLPADKISAQENENAEVMDQIVAVVNNHTILKSDVDQQVRDYMLQLQQEQNREITFSKDIWYTVLQNIVDRFVVLDQARKDSITISDERVNEEIDRRINNYIQQLGSERAFEQQMGKSVLQMRADLQVDFRQQMIVSQYQSLKRDEINITRPEVEAYFNDIPNDSLPVIPERVSVSHIVVKPPALNEARQEVLQLAEALRDSLLNHGKSMEELARTYSDGPSASDGGALGMIPVNQLVGAYSAAASALQPGEISEVVETSFGFHIIRLNKRVGDQIDTNHILLELDQNKFDDQAAIDKLEQIKDSVLTREDITFAQMARKHSEDPNTAPNGGRILNPQTGESLIPMNQLDPNLYRISLLLEEEGDISDPKEFNVGSGNQARKAFRIVRLNRRIPEHTANLEQDYDRIRQVALREKQFREIQDWISKLKEKFYVEYKIPIPDNIKNI